MTGVAGTDTTGNDRMFTLDKIDLQRITVSTIGAVLLSTVCVLGAVAPARAAHASVPVAQNIR